MPVGRVVGLLKTNTSRGIKEKFPVLKKATGVSMVFGRMATLSRRSVLPQTLSDVILKIRANWMRVKELRSLTDRRVASVFIPCGVSPGFLIYADSVVGEPMTARPSIGKSVYLKLVS